MTNKEAVKILNQYDAYTRSPDHHKKYGRAWKRIRDRYVRSYPVCERCLAEGRITPVEEVHHIVPVSRGGQHVDSNLMSLCQSCHTKIHVEMGERNKQGVGLLEAILLFGAVVAIFCVIFQIVGVLMV